MIYVFMIDVCKRCQIHYSISIIFCHLAFQNRELLYFIVFSHFFQRLPNLNIKSIIYITFCCTKRTVSFFWGSWWTWCLFQFEICIKHQDYNTEKMQYRQINCYNIYVQSFNTGHFLLSLMILLI